MTIAHLSDTHLGFRAYSRLSSSGFNQREVDVIMTFLSCLDAIAERDPDVVVHAGDLFHVVRPSNATIVRTFQALTRFQAERKGRPFILIGGNHDTPRTVEGGNILSLFSDIPGIRIAPRERTVFDVEDLDLEVLALPSTSLTRGGEMAMAPSLGRKHRLLTIHGMAYQALPHHHDFRVEDVQHELWTYVALGDYHSFQAYGRNVCYSGSTDYASTNIWDEIRQPKGWVWFDDLQGIEFVPLITRLVLDLPVIDALGMTASELEQALLSRVHWDPQAMPIVRQRILNLHPAIRAKVDYRTIREIASKTLNYQIQAKAPIQGDEVKQAGEASNAMTLERSWQEHVSAANLPPGTDRANLISLGTSMLKEVAESETHSFET